VESSAAALFPWRQLGELLVDEQLLTPTELEIALEEQRRTGRLLGQIVVDHGFVSAFSLARVLSAQHGVELHAVSEPEPQPVDPTQVAPPAQLTWQPLGKLLLEKGLVTDGQLEEALQEQRRDRRLGEILVERGVLTGTELARALGEQYGLEPASLNDLDDGVETVIKPAQPQEPVYRVFSVAFRQGFQERSQLSESGNFLEAADFAMEYVQEHSPDALEIERVQGDESETVWTYSESRAAAATAARKDLVDTFGFDPTKWGREL
jgi:hypothetical protein